MKRTPAAGLHGTGRGRWAAPCLVTAALLVTGVPAIALAAGGNLDHSFGAGGKVVQPRGEAEAVALQTDGKIVVAGGRGPAFQVARYDTDGSLDTTFAGDGSAQTTFGPRRCQAFAFGVAIQTDQKVVAVGTSVCGSAERFALARYDTDGTLDATFSGDGRVTTAFAGRHPSASAQAVAIQGDGRIVAAGISLRGTNRHRVQRFALARYDTDGALDANFGSGGRITTDITPGFDEAFGVAVQTDGKIVAAGTAALEQNTERMALARYAADGSLDPSFGDDGTVTTSFRSRRCGGSQGRAVTLQPNGRIIVAGVVGCGHPYFALARYRADGHLDPTFSGDGKVAAIFAARDCADFAYAVAVQGNGRIVAAGTAGCFSPRFALLRTTSIGRLDSSFGDHGKVTTRLVPGSNCFDQANGVVIQQDGKIVAAGLAGCSTGRFGLVRYLAS